jgi:ABC-type nitrate/sulfonate/bicarbonate transport system substrate-binding protein
MTYLCRRAAKALLLSGLVAQLPLASNAAAEVVRFGKPVAGAFTFALLDVGVRAGIFKRHGLDIEISAFTGGTRLVQAETAGSIDIAFNTGPDMALIFKGAPVRAVALVSDSPLDLCLLVRPDLPVTSPADLKGKRITVSSPFAMTAWMTRELARQEGWGARREFSSFRRRAGLLLRCSTPRTSTASRPISEADCKRRSAATPRWSCASASE